MTPIEKWPEGHFSMSNSDPGVIFRRRILTRGSQFDVENWLRVKILRFLYTKKSHPTWKILTPIEFWPPLEIRWRYFSEHIGIKRFLERHQIVDLITLDKKTYFVVLCLGFTVAATIFKSYSDTQRIKSGVRSLRDRAIMFTDLKSLSFSPLQFRTLDGDRILQVRKPSSWLAIGLLFYMGASVHSGSSSTVTV